MPRPSQEARAAAQWRKEAARPIAPKTLSKPAALLWKSIVDDRPGDFFRPGSLHLLANWCEIYVAHTENIARLAEDPGNLHTIDAVKKLVPLVLQYAVKLRLTVQANVTRQARSLDEQPPVDPDKLLGGEWADNELGDGRRH